MLKIVFILFFIFSNQVFAQSLDTKIQPAFGTSDDFYTLTLSISGEKVSPLSLVKFDESDTFKIIQQGTSSRRQIINRKESSEFSISFQVSFKKNVLPGEYPLPNGTVEVNGVRVKIPNKKISVVSTIKPNKRKTTNKYTTPSSIKISQYLNKKSAYVGEQITYTAEITHDNSFVGGNLEDYEISGFWREKLGNKERNTYNLSGKTVSTFQEVLIPVKSGRISIPPRILQAKIKSSPSFKQRQRRRRRTRGFGSIFEQFGIFDRHYSRKNLKTNSIDIEIKPLPATSISGYIPVGSLNEKTRLNKKTINAGESANLNITINGTANLRPFNLEDSKRSDENFKLYFEKADLRTGSQDGILVFSKSYNITIVPKKSGEIEIPQFTIDYFDPEQEKYKKLKTKRLKLKVKGQFPKSPKNTELTISKDTGSEDTLDLNEIAPLNKSSLKNSLRLSNSLTIILSILTLLGTIALRTIFNKKAFLRDNPNHLKRKNALKNAFDLIERNETEQGVKKYLEDTFSINTAIKTPKEIKTELEKKSNDKKTIEEICSFLENSETRTFSKNKTRKNQDPKIKSLLLKLQETLEENIS